MHSPPADMALYTATAILSSVRGLIQGKLGYDSQCPSALIDILNDDSLLYTFFLCRPESLDAEEDDAGILGGRKWHNGRWWYGLAQVCRRWRYIMLDSVNFLGLSFHCTYGTPVADILAHSPCLPLILDYCDYYDYFTADDELAIISALEHRDRVRRIRLMQPVEILQRLVKTLHGEFPKLESLFIERHTFYTPSPNGDRGDNAIVDIPETFRAPRLRYFVLMGFPIPIASPIYTTMENLVALSLDFETPTDYFHPNILLQFSVMPLDISVNCFKIHLPSEAVDNQLLRRRALMRRVRPYLRRFGLQGANAYLEALLPRATIRLVERFQLNFFNRLKPYLILPRRSQLNPTDVLSLGTATITFFKDHLRVDTHSCSYDGNFRPYRFCMSQGGRHLDRQLASVTKFAHTFATVFAPVESLIIQYDGPPSTPGPQRNNEADSAQWHELFRAFGNVKSLYMSSEFVGQLSRALRPVGSGDVSSPTADLLLPELCELWYAVEHPQLENPGRSPFGPFGPFAEVASARRNAGRPINVIRTRLPLSGISLLSLL